MKKTTAFILFFFYFSHSAAFAQESVRETPVVKVVREWAPSVVNIATEKIVFLRQHPFWKNYGSQLDALMRDYYQPHYSALKLKSIGSGVVIKSEGLIVTNAHVVHMATKVYVVFNDGKYVEGKVILVNQDDDLAFIKVDPPYALRPVRLANTQGIMTGETVIAIGNPLGLENSVTTGVISGKNRSFYASDTKHTFTELLQTDAPINIGNSGGALLNLEGQLVGINLAVFQNANNIGFAIPAKKIEEGIQYYESHPSSSDPSSS